MLCCVAKSSKLNLSLLKGAGAFINQGNNEMYNSQEIKKPHKAQEASKMPKMYKTSLKA